MKLNLNCFHACHSEFDLETVAHMKLARDKFGHSCSIFITSSWHHKSSSTRLALQTSVTLHWTQWSQTMLTLYSTGWWASFLKQSLDCNVYNYKIFIISLWWWHHVSVVQAQLDGIPEESESPFVANVKTALEQDRFTFPFYILTLNNCSATGSWLLWLCILDLWSSKKNAQPKCMT